MLPLQRRTFAICIFAFSFILFYEARGQRLLDLYNEAVPEGSAALEDHFWTQVSMGAFVLVVGTFLIFVLRRKGQRLELGRGELAAYALAVGILFGTAFVSWK